METCSGSAKPESGRPLCVHGRAGNTRTRVCGRRNGSLFLGDQELFSETKYSLGTGVGCYVVAELVPVRAEEEPGPLSCTSAIGEGARKVGQPLQTALS